MHSLSVLEFLDKVKMVSLTRTFTKRINSIVDIGN